VSTSRSRSTQSQSALGTAEAQFDQIAERLRKLNERIIKAGKEAGETTLTSYEKALKAIAGTLERGPGRSDIDWISNLATTQAKFIRDVTTAWTSVARERLK
jgi:DNA-binding ferritin-like protein